MDGWVSIDYWKQTLVKKDLEDSLNDKTWSKPSHYRVKFSSFLVLMGKLKMTESYFRSYSMVKRSSHIFSSWMVKPLRKSTMHIFHTECLLHSMAIGSQNFSEVLLFLNFALIY